MKRKNVKIYKKVTRYEGIKLYVSTSHDDDDNYHSWSAILALAPILSTTTYYFTFDKWGKN